MGTSSDAYALLLSYLGTVEDPPGSNHCSITDRFAAISGWSWAASGNAWCDMTVSVVLSDSGTPTIFAYCPSHVNAFQDGSAGAWLGGSQSLVEQMDVVFFDWNGDGVADHVGFVQQDNGDGTLNTIEGNSSGPNGDGVYRQHRARSLILGFGRPAYTQTSGGTVALDPADLDAIQQRVSDALTAFFGVGAPILTERANQAPKLDEIISKLGGAPGGAHNLNITLSGTGTPS